MFKEIILKLKSSSLFKDSFWALAGSFIGRGLSLVASIVIARLLGKDLFGIYGFARTTLLSIAVFSTFGLGYSATKFIAEYTKNKPYFIKSIIDDFNRITITTSSIFAILIFIFSKEISVYLGSPEQFNSIRYLAVIVIFNSITTTQTGVLAGFKKFKVLTKINTVNGFVTFVLGVGLTYFYSIDGALIALLLSQGYNCMQNYIVVRKCIRSLKVEHKKVSLIKDLTTFSLPITLHEMVSSISQWVLPFLIVKFSNTGDLGIYSAATQWSAVIMFIPGTLQNVVFSHLTTHNDNVSYQKNIVRRMLQLNFIATAVPFLIIMLFSKLIVQFYGESFEGLKTVINICVFTTIFNCMTLVIKNYFVSINKPWFTFLIFVFSNVIIIITFIFSQVSGKYPTVLSLVSIQVTTTIITYIIYYISYKKQSIII
ncbi:MAG: oligosaccharide flippase family protein [Rikenellaceae bacterium]